MISPCTTWLILYSKTVTSNVHLCQGLHLCAFCSFSHEFLALFKLFIILHTVIYDFMRYLDGQQLLWHTQ